MMKFIMVQKGHKYETAEPTFDGIITINKTWIKYRKRVSEYSTLDKWVWESRWSIHIPSRCEIVSFHLLKDAKKFVEDYYSKEVR